MSKQQGEKTYKKYIVTQGDGECASEVYFRNGVGEGYIFCRAYPRQVRMVPSPSDRGWAIPTGPEGYTLAALEDTGNDIVLTFDGRDGEVRFDYSEWQDILTLARIIGMNVDKEKSSRDSVYIQEDPNWEPEEDVREYYEDLIEEDEEKVAKWLLGDGHV